MFRGMDGSQTEDRDAPKPGDDVSGEDFPDGSNSQRPAELDQTAFVGTLVKVEILVEYNLGQCGPIHHFGRIDNQGS